jgi:DNA-binding beta-propeller fold protein YncE
MQKRVKGKFLQRESSSRRRSVSAFCSILIIMSSGGALMGRAAENFMHFEARHCHPIEFTPDGAKLLAVNAPEGRLSVFSTDSREIPLLISEIPVGLEPVTVRARTNDEAWVVNEVSDSVSIINLSSGTVVATLSTPDEPADVVFAAGKAFITCARSNKILIFDALTRTPLVSIPLQGVFPRALAVSADGSRLYAAFLLSGNNTTALHFRDAPAQPLPTTPALPPAPQTALIVPDSDPRISYDVIDHDIVEINTSNHAIVRYHQGIGTNILSLACNPSGMLWVGASEARNLIRFEPSLNGIFAESRIARIANEQITTLDLNPHASAPQIAPSEASLSLSQPMAIIADDNGAWLAAFGSDRIARLNNNGTVTQRIDLRGNFPQLVRGPRGITKHPTSGNLAILNKLSQTVSFIDPTNNQVLGEIPLSSHNPLTLAQQQGRGFFYDARLSGNGTVSCGSCHFDADIDGVAWDLGDPTGTMLTVVGSSPSIGQPGPVNRILHPMKGPMVTQPLRGIKGAGPFHWRGDKANIQEFNTSFSNLQAGQPLPSADMDKVAAYIESLRNHPNPHRLPDNTLPAALQGGNPTQGRVRFHELNVCSKCHTGDRGTNHILDDFSLVLTRQPVKNSTLEHSYKKVYFTPYQATSLSGYGFTHDGTGSDIPRGHEYALDFFENYPTAIADVTAFLLCFNTDTKPAVGFSSPSTSTLLESQATQGNCDLIAHAMIHGEQRTFLFDPATNKYRPDNLTENPLSAAQLMAQASTVRFSGVPTGTGLMRSIDRNVDGILNRDTTPPRLHIDSFFQPMVDEAQTDWFIESSTDLQNWTPAPTSSPMKPKQFFRLHRTW